MKPVLVDDKEMALSVMIHGLPSHSSEPSFVQAGGEVFGWFARWPAPLCSKSALIHRIAMQCSSMLNNFLEHAAFNIGLRRIPGSGARPWAAEAEWAICDRAIRKLADRLLV